MTEKNVINMMQQDIRIPDIVQRKADIAFEKIMAESKEAGEEDKEGMKMGKTAAKTGTVKAENRRRKTEKWEGIKWEGIKGEENGRKSAIKKGVKGKNPKTRGSGKRKWKTMWVAVAAAVFVLGTTVCAAYMRWTKGLERQFEATEEEKVFLEEQEIAAPASGSATVGNVTVTAQQSIVDKQFAHLSFRVEGYSLDEGEEPGFEYTSIDINGKSVSWNGRFYNGIEQGEDGKSYYADGSEVEETPDGARIERFVDENGNMEFMVDLLSSGDGEDFIGKTLHVCFRNLGTVEKAAFVPDLEGVWEFDVELKGSDERKNFTLSEELGDSGATVTYAEISPISIAVTYQFAAEEIEMPAVDQDGNAYMAKDYDEPPMISGVRLKDGTYLTGLFGGGKSGWEDLEKGIYRSVISTNRIIDTSQVDALLFIKSYPEQDVDLSEENLYIVPVE